VTPFVLGQYNLTSHGSATSDFTMAIDGPARQQPVRQRPVQRLLHERRGVQELTYSTGSESAEIQSSGIRSTGAEGRRQQVLGLLLPLRPGQLAPVPTTAPTR
jgi:hypothetical protein